MFSLSCFSLKVSQTPRNPRHTGYGIRHSRLSRQPHPVTHSHSHVPTPIAMMMNLFSISKVPLSTLRSTCAISTSHIGQGMHYRGSAVRELCACDIKNNRRVKLARVLDYTRGDSGCGSTPRPANEAGTPPYHVRKRHLGRGATEGARAHDVASRGGQLSRRGLTRPFLPAAWPTPSLLCSAAASRRSRRRRACA